MVIYIIFILGRNPSVKRIATIVFVAMVSSPHPYSVLELELPLFWST